MSISNRSLRADRRHEPAIGGNLISQPAVAVTKQLLPPNARSFIGRPFMPLHGQTLPIIDRRLHHTDQTKHGYVASLYWRGQIKARHLFANRNCLIRHNDSQMWNIKRKIPITRSGMRAESAFPLFEMLISKNWMSTFYTGGRAFFNTARAAYDTMKRVHNQCCAFQVSKYSIHEAIRWTEQATTTTRTLSWQQALGKKCVGGVTEDVETCHDSEKMFQHHSSTQQGLCSALTQNCGFTTVTTTIWNLTNG